MRKTLANIIGRLDVESVIIAALGVIALISLILAYEYAFTITLDR